MANLFSATPATGPSFEKDENEVLEDAEDQDNFQSEADDEDEERRLGKLLDKISSIPASTGDKRQKSRARQTEPSELIGEYNFSNRLEEKEKLNLHDLIRGAKDSAGDLRKSLKKLNKKRPLELPTEKHISDKAVRIASYQETSKSLSKWDPVVEHNRNADQLQFPLKQPDLRLPPAREIIQRFRPRTEMELKIQELLQTSENRLEDDKALTVAEEKYLKAMSLDEARARHKELQKMRVLLSYHEVKMKRQSKIKSKTYHRILKKERQKIEAKSLQELGQTDPEGALEQLNEADRIRALERASLKHRDTGKWAKFKKLRSSYDDKARQALNEQLDLNRKLMEKMVKEDEIEEEEIDDDEILDDDEDGFPQVSMEYNPWMKSIKQQIEDATKSKRKLADMKNQHDPVEINESSNQDEQLSRIIFEEKVVSCVEADDEDDDEIGITEPTVENEGTSLKNKRRRKKGKNKKLKKSINPTESMDDTKSKVSEKKQNGKSMKGRQINKEESSVEGENISMNMGMEEMVKVQTEKEKNDISKSANIGINPNKYFTLDPQRVKSAFPNFVETNSDGEDEQRKLIAEAFADDDVVCDFEAEKEDVISSQALKDTNNFLPGWGSWAGTGIKIDPKKKRKFTIKAKKIERKDEKLPNVIISEKMDQSLRKYMVKSLPFPYKNVVQFENSIRNPIGSTWNPETAVRELTEPKVTTLTGKIIAPIDEDALIERKSRKGKTFHAKRQKGEKRLSEIIHCG